MSEALCRNRHNASYADFAVMPTLRQERAAGGGDGRERSA
jgi:hypothetical protein